MYFTSWETEYFRAKRDLTDYLIKCPLLTNEEIKIFYIVSFKVLDYFPLTVYQVNINEIILFV